VTYGISVERLPDAGAPQVGITVTGLGGAAVVSVDVSWDGGGSWHGVRGAQRVTLVGGGFVRDHVPPLNVPAIYRLVVHGSTPAAAGPTEAAITVQSGTAWLQDPLAPRTAVAVRVSPGGDPGSSMLELGSLAGATYAQAVDVVIPQGASLPVASVGQRTLAGEVPLVVSHDVAAEGGALRRLLLSGGQLVARGLPANVLEPVAHIVVGPARETRSGDDLRVSTWQLTAMQTRPQSLRIVVPWWTYDQVAALWTGRTYADARDSRPGDTYLDWQRNPEVP